MSLFDAPVIKRITKADFVLKGGRTRLRVALVGWGRLMLSLGSQTGTVEERRMWFFGGDRELFVDVLPPGEVTIDVRNPFGEDSTTISIRADLPGIADLPPPLVQPVPTVSPPPVPVPFLLPVPEVQLPRVRLRAISLKTIHDSRSHRD